MLLILDDIEGGMTNAPRFEDTLKRAYNGSHVGA